MTWQLCNQVISGISQDVNLVELRASEGSSANWRNLTRSGEFAIENKEYMF